MKNRPFKHLAHPSPFAGEPIVFFTVVTFDRAPILARPDVHAILHGYWSRSGSANGWYVGDYLIMPDHVHLFARAGRDAQKMADWVKMWKSASSRDIARATGRHPPVWQEEYFDRFLRSSENFSDKWNYVSANPVRAGLAANPDDWPYRGRIHDLRY